MCEGHFSLYGRYFMNPNDEDVEKRFQRWCPNFTMIQRLTNPRSSFYLDRFECMREKERVLGGGGEGKIKLRERGSVETMV